MNDIQWILHPQFTMLQAKHAPLFEQQFYCITFSSCLAADGGHARLAHIFDPMIEWCSSMFTDAYHQSSRLDACVDTLFSIHTDKALSVLHQMMDICSPDAQRRIYSYLYEQWLVSAHPYYLRSDELCILADAQRLQYIETQMETSEYWFHHIDMQQDWWFLDGLLIQDTYPRDDALMYKASALCCHLDTVTQSAKGMHIGDRVYLRMPYKYLDAGRRGTIIERDRGNVIVSWHQSRNLFRINSLLLSKIG